jgi:hypothetical protein
MVEELSDPPEKVDVLQPIIAAPAPAFERLDLRKFGFSKPEYMCRQLKFLGNFPVVRKAASGLVGAPGACCLVLLVYLRPVEPWPLMQLLDRRRQRIGSDHG